MSGCERTFCPGKCSTQGGRAIAVLTVLFVAQIGLAVLLKLSEKSYQPVEATAPMLSCDFNRIREIVIEQRDSEAKCKSQVILEKDKQGWKLPDYYDFRANIDNVNRLLSSLKELKKGFPVTTTAGAAERFKVSSNNYERAVCLYDDRNTATTLYLGSSPNFRVVYAKTPDSNNIYTAGISDYQVSAIPADWIDRTMTALTASEVTSVDMGTFQVRKVDGKWLLVTKNKQELISKRVAFEFANTVTNVTISSVLGTKADPDYNLDKPVLSYGVTLQNGSVVTFTFAKPKGRSPLVLKVSDKSWYFTVGDWLVNRLKGLSAESLRKNQDSEEARQKQLRKETKHSDRTK